MSLLRINLLGIHFIAFFTMLTGCNALSDTTAGHIQILEELALPEKLKETSGLFCMNSTAVTVNDSGNSAEIFVIDRHGNIVSSSTINTHNHDWEAITGDTDFYYVGDVGNNRGERKNLRVLKISRATGKLQTIIPIAYEANNPEQNSAYAHDYDAEGLVVKDGHLLLFSKSWKTQTLHIYKVNLSGSSTKLAPFRDVSGLPGVITGADWSEALDSYLLVGYKLNFPGRFAPFIAILDADFQVKRVESLPLQQVEGVCAQSAQEIWVTQEASSSQPAKFIKLKLTAP